MKNIHTLIISLRFFEDKINIHGKSNKEIGV